LNFGLKQKSRPPVKGRAMKRWYLVTIEGKYERLCYEDTQLEAVFG
jgi:hypothetical protein